jgi:hypothetical protein
LNAVGVFIGIVAGSAETEQQERRNPGRMIVIFTHDAHLYFLSVSLLLRFLDVIET